MKSCVKIILALSGAVVASSLALASPLTGAPCNTSCPVVFHKIDDRYVFIARDLMRFQNWNWDESRNLCTSVMKTNDTWSTDLAAVDASFLRAFSEYIINKVPDIKNYVFWVGASLINGLWQWTDGSPISNTSYIWLMDSPIFKYEKANGMLIPGGAFNRFYMYEYEPGFRAPSYLCEAKRRA